MAFWLRFPGCVPGLLAVLLLSTLALPASADPSAFDLAGPRIEVRIQRASKTLPIGEVPNLQPGDRLWLHPVLDKTQSVRYLMVTVFLRGSTNPPPNDWFTRTETWSKKIQQEGTYVVVPKGAEQALVFFAPVTGGDFSTLRSAVRGKPGAFVRASQDLNQASIDRARLDAYLNVIERTDRKSPEDLKPVSEMLARSLTVKVDPQCFEQATEQQASCLTQHQNTLVLDDGHATSRVAALASGPASDLALQASYSPQASYGYYASYVGVVVDLAKLMDNLHTAEYQYIPALASMHMETVDSLDSLNLKLNTPPSFHNPKSVLVVALPDVSTELPPPLRPVDPKHVYCLEAPKLVLPAEGAPVFFATAYGHDLRLSLKSTTGKDIDFPATPDPSVGGLVVDTTGLNPTSLPSGVTATLRGMWGFTPYEGPSFHLQNAHPISWEVAAADKNALVIGRQDTLHLSGDGAACVSEVSIEDAAGTTRADWKLTRPDAIEVKVPLEDAQPGKITLTIAQFGLLKKETITLSSFAQAAHLTGFAIHSGDPTGVLEGTRLDEVASLNLGGEKFTPGKLQRAGDGDRLQMQIAPGASSASLSPDTSTMAHALLRDGRTIDVPATVQVARPRVSLITKSVQLPPEMVGGKIQLGSADEVPPASHLIFSLKAIRPATFSRGEQIEVGSEDGNFSVLLGLTDGSLVLQDSSTALATIDTSKSFGMAAFGKISFRPVDAAGGKGDWQPLASLVRLPQLETLRCPATRSPKADSKSAVDPKTEKPCTLGGENLFLVDSIASDAAFTDSITVPDGFADSTLLVPHPIANQLYLKLRDNPAIVNTINMPPEIIPAPKSHAIAKEAKAVTPATSVASSARETATPQTPMTTRAESTGAPGKPQ